MSGLAPGKLAETLIVGNSTCGKDETGKKLKATMPAIATPIASRVVASMVEMMHERAPSQEHVSLHGLAVGAVDAVTPGTGVEVELTDAEIARNVAEAFRSAIAQCGK